MRHRVYRIVGACAGPGRSGRCSLPLGLLIGLAVPANAEDGSWDPTLPPVISAGAPGDPVAIANQSLQATANATQTTIGPGTPVPQRPGHQPGR